MKDLRRVNLLVQTAAIGASMYLLGVQGTRLTAVVAVVLLIVLLVLVEGTVSS
jgi:hypothetical protein